MTVYYKRLLRLKDKYSGEYYLENLKMDVCTLHPKG